MSRRSKLFAKVYGGTSEEVAFGAIIRGVHHAEDSGIVGPKAKPVGKRAPIVITQSIGSAKARRLARTISRRK